ncbi:LPXTG cell wall anchor domain-containing protein [Rubrobacter tropicus]|uniref:LPXTG cell wall anchor domain-containing protein n=2 Tax=Rubrobacter tropicus TaxID=2653851 RepID=A0A6G8QET2_9ACTN|nr:LPXTG cell wall anchor domain-containing protein [Rubrobacter tropicus]
MLLAAMLAMVLAAAAPALAQDAVAVDEGTATGGDVQYVDCSQVQELTVNQGQYGDAVAAADDESAAVAGIAQELGITQQQVNACLGEVGAVAGGDINVDGSAAADEGSASAAADEGSASAAAEGSASAAAEGELPETGGASLLALGAGALLVAGGLLARRIVR